MEFQKIVNSPEITHNDRNSSRFVTKTKVYNQSKKNYSINKEIKIKTPFVLSTKHNTIV